MWSLTPPAFLHRFQQVLKNNLYHLLLFDIALNSLHLKSLNLSSTLHMHLYFYFSTASPSVFDFNNLSCLTINFFFFPQPVEKIIYFSYMRVALRKPRCQIAVHLPVSTRFSQWHLHRNICKCLCNCSTFFELGDLLSMPEQFVTMLMYTDETQCVDMTVHKYLLMPLSANTNYEA